VELEAVGLIELCHNRGAVVKPFGPEQLRDFFHVRRILETEAARSACGRIQADSLAGLRREMEGLRTSGEGVLLFYTSPH